MKSFANDYTPLKKVKAQVIEPKSILKKFNRRDSQTPYASELSAMSDKRVSLAPPPPVPSSPRPIRGSGKEIKNSSDSRISSPKNDAKGLPLGSDKGGPLLSPPPVSNSPRPMRKENESDLEKPSPKNDTVGLDEHQLKSGRSSLKSGKVKDVPSHEITKDSASPNVPTGSPVPLSGQKGPEPSDNITLGKAILESGKVEDAKLHKIRSSSVTKSSSSHSNGKKNYAENVVKQDSSTFFVPKKAPEPSSTASGPSELLGMGSKSEDIYGGFIGFENAILETGDDQVNVRKAKIQKIRSKR